MACKRRFELLSIDLWPAFPRCHFAIVDDAVVWSVSSYHPADTSADNSHEQSRITGAQTANYRERER